MSPPSSSLTNAAASFSASHHTYFCVRPAASPSSSSTPPPRLASSWASSRLVSVLTFALAPLTMLTLHTLQRFLLALALLLTYGKQTRAFKWRLICCCSPLADRLLAYSHSKNLTTLRCNAQTFLYTPHKTFLVCFVYARNEAFLHGKILSARSNCFLSWPAARHNFLFVFIKTSGKKTPSARARFS